MIRVMGVSKKFRIYTSPADRLKEKLFRRPYHHEYAALSDISFEVGPGETLGIIGENGAGKSTLLKILSGVLLPDTGSVEVSGKITGLLELGTGFNPELSGFENIYMNGTFLGMSHAEIEAKKDTIIEFAELGEFIHEPIKTYSSGMMMRLGFAIAIHADPECFLVDEALSVGDAYFQQKCMRKIQEFKEQGGSIIFVSHDMNAVLTLCDSAFMLESGKIILMGNPKEVSDYYQNTILQRSHFGDANDISVTITGNNNWGKHSNLKSESIEIISMKILSERGDEINTVASEETIILDVKFQSKIDLEDPHIGFKIRNKYGLVIYETNSWWMNQKVGYIRASEMVYIQFCMNIPLSAGDYSFSVGIADKPIGRGMFQKYLFMGHDMIMLNIVTNNEAVMYSGLFNMKSSIMILND